MTTELSESRQDAFPLLGWGSGIPNGWKSATAFCLYQANLKPWTDELNTPRPGWLALQEASAKHRAEILDFAKRKNAPFTAREIMDAFRTYKSRTDYAISRLEREGIIRRTNRKGRLHWEVI
jgi:predicted HTH transcriptional regulator